MTTHVFLLDSGIWLGEGKIQFSKQEITELRFYTRWQVSLAPEGGIVALQEIEIVGAPEKTQNNYHFSKADHDRFLVQLENELFGKIRGKGLLSPESIAWEFHGEELEFEGFEVYQRQHDGTYLTRAEYSSFGEPHTVISGTLWKK